MAGNNGHSNGKITYLSDPAVIFQHSTRRKEPVRIPEWEKPNAKKDEEVWVLVQGLTTPERRKFLANGFMDDPKNPGTRIRNNDWFDNHRDAEMIVATVIREDGSPLFSRAQAEELCNADDPAPSIRLVAAGERTSAIDNDTFEALRKNSGSPTSDSYSVSRSPSASPA